MKNFDDYEQYLNNSLKSQLVELSKDEEEKEFLSSIEFFIKPSIRTDCFEIHSRRNNKESYILSLTNYSNRELNEIFYDGKELFLRTLLYDFSKKSKKQIL